MYSWFVRRTSHAALLSSRSTVRRGRGGVGVHQSVSAAAHRVGAPCAGERVRRPLRAMERRTGCRRRAAEPDAARRSYRSDSARRSRAVRRSARIAGRRTATARRPRLVHGVPSIARPVGAYRLGRFRGLRRTPPALRPSTSESPGVRRRRRLGLGGVQTSAAYGGDLPSAQSCVSSHLRFPPRRVAPGGRATGRRLAIDLHARHAPLSPRVVRPARRLCDLDHRSFRHGQRTRGPRRGLVAVRAVRGSNGQVRRRRC